MTQEKSHEPGPETITVTDKRRIDPETGEVRQGASEPAPSGPAPDAVAGVSADIDEVAELIADLQRVKAEYDNFRKRSLRERDVAAEQGKVSVLTQLLGVLDDLDRARSHGDLESGPLKSVADKLTDALGALGLAAFGEEGDDFNPDHHEAVQHEGDGGRPVIGAVLRRGYKLGEKVLRHAMVGVVDTVPENDEDTGGGETPDAADAAGQAAES